MPPQLLPIIAGVAGVVALGAIVGDGCAVHKVVHGLGDVRCVIADAFKVLRAKQQVGGEPDVARNVDALARLAGLVSLDGFGPANRDIGTIVSA